MNKCIAILGAGPGLGASLARRYGRDGYSVALVARRAQPLKDLAKELSNENIRAEVFTADLRSEQAVLSAIAQIQSLLGPIDALYYGPNAPESFVPAFTLNVEALKVPTELFLYGMVAAISAVLPSMRARKQGAILVGLGGSAAIGLPFMSGPGPALAAARNYLHSLQGELAAEGVFVGMLILSAVIQNSGWHSGIKSGNIKLDLPPGFQIPEVHPDQLAEMLKSAADQRGPSELVYPAPLQ